MPILLDLLRIGAAMLSGDGHDLDAGDHDDGGHHDDISDASHHPDPAQHTDDHEHSTAPALQFSGGCDCGYSPGSCKTGPFCRWQY